MVDHGQEAGREERLGLLLDAVVTIAAGLSLDSVLQRIVALPASWSTRGTPRSACSPRRPTAGCARSSTTACPRAWSTRSATCRAGSACWACSSTTRTAAAARHRRAPGVVRVPRPPPADAVVPRCAGPHPRPGLRQPLPHREGGRRGLHAADEDIVVALAAAAGVAIENARLYDEAARRQRWLAATAEITAILRPATREPTPCRRSRTGPARWPAPTWPGSWPARTGPRSSCRATSGREGGPRRHEALSLDRSLAGCGGDRRHGGRRRPRHRPAGPRRLAGLRLAEPRSGRRRAAAVGASRSTARSPWRGAASGPRSTTPSTPRCRPASPSTPRSALQIVRAREDRQRLAVLEDRDRIGRDLHDVVIQRLFAVGLGLQGPPGWSTAPTSPRASTRRSTTWTRRSRTSAARSSRWPARRLPRHPGRGDAAGRPGGGHAEVPADPPVRGPGPHAGRRRPRTGPAGGPRRGAVQRQPARGRPDGRGRRQRRRPHRAPGGRRRTRPGRGVHESGLRNMRERAERRGGAFVVESARGEGTTLTWSVPAT